MKPELMCLLPFVVIALMPCIVAVPVLIELMNLLIERVRAWMS